MSAFDLVIIVILIALTLRGVWKGMVSQIVSVGSLVVCWIVASRFAFLIAPSIPAEAPWNKVGAMIVLFAVTMIAIRFVHGFMEKKLKDWHLSGLNTFFGGGLGLAKGLILCMVLTFFGVTISVGTREMVFQSKSGRHLADLIAKTGTFIPKDSCDLLRAQIDLFNAKMEGEAESTVRPAEQADDYLQQMLAAREDAGDEAQQDSKFGEYLSRTGAVLGEIQSLRDDLEQNKSKASSLLDAIGRWWNGDAAVTQLTDTQDATETVKAAATVIAETPRSETPVYTPPRAENLAELFQRENAALAKEVPTGEIVNEAMGMPRPSSSFRLRRSGANQRQNSEHLLHSTQSNRSAEPAAVFSGR